MKRKIGVLFLFLVLANVGAWAWALILFRSRPVLMGAAVLAYTFGLRHAFDADHIAAIDNVTRKLMQQRKRPLLTGFFFSLGHALVMLLATLAIIFAVAHVDKHFLALNDAAGTIGTIVSAVFLFLMAAINLAIAAATFKTFRHVVRGGEYSDEDFDLLLNGRGFLSRIFRPLFAFISQSWQLLFIGFLFGLGFDTVTEIGLLSIVGVESTRGLSAWSLLVFPAIFAAGMSLMDTTDGVLMVSAYGWAFLKPVRKIYYNLTMTVASVAVALVVGGVETLGLLAHELNLRGQFFARIGALDDHFGYLGVGIVGIFVLSWIVSVLIYRYKRYDSIEATRASILS